MNENIKKFTFMFNPKIREDDSYQPSWKNKIERWHQLDEAAFALCEAVSEWSQNENFIFDEIIFLTQKGSNLADAEFVASQPISPAKFVYTLPSVAPSVMSHLFGWSGPVFCLGVTEKDELTLRRSLELAQQKRSSENKKTFILQLFATLNEAGYRVLDGYIVF
jgi:hypothetical protein